MKSNASKSQSRPAVSIYYDGNCQFCKRSVELIVKWFLVRVTEAAAAQTKPEIYSIMMEYDSWVVVNEKGQRFTTFKAGVEIARHSPILQWLAPLSRLPLMSRFGEWVYRKIAKHRSRLPLP